MELRNTKKSNNNNRNLVPSFSGLVTSGSSDFFDSWLFNSCNWLFRHTGLYFRTGYRQQSAESMTKTDHALSEPLWCFKHLLVSAFLKYQTKWKHCYCLWDRTHVTNIFLNKKYCKFTFAKIFVNYPQHCYCLGDRTHITNIFLNKKYCRFAFAKNYPLHDLNILDSLSRSSIELSIGFS